MALAAAAMLTGPMVATPQDVQAAKNIGLVVVNIEGNKDLVDVALAAELIVQACDVVDATVAANILAALTAIEQNGGNATFCRTEGGKVSAKNG